MQWDDVQSCLEVLEEAELPRHIPQTVVVRGVNKDDYALDPDAPPLDWS